MLRCRTPDRSALRLLWQLQSHTKRQAAGPTAPAGNGTEKVSSFGFDQEISNTPDGVNFGSSLRLLQLAPQMMYVHGHCIGFELVINAVQLLFQHGLGHDAPLTSQQVLQDCAFAPGQLQRDAADLYIPSDRIQGDVAGLESDAKRAPGSSQQGFGAGDEL